MRPLASWPLVVMIGASAFSLGAAATSAYVQDWTTDEPDHLEWSRRLLDTGVTERTSALHFNSKTPVVAANVVARRLARRVLGIRDGNVLRFANRLPTVGWLAALLAAVFLAARPLVGRDAACLATAMTAADPSMIAHASVATVDVPFALATVLVLAAGARFWRQGGAWPGALLGVALGFAFVVKFSAFLLLPALAVLGLFRPWRPRPRPSAARLLSGAACAALAAGALVCAGYLFHGVGVRLGTVAWRTPVMARLAAALPALPSPVPIDFLTGVDVSVAAERTKEWPVAILGEPRRGRLPYYFALLWLVKTPVAVLLAQAAGFVLLWRSRLLRRAPVLAALAVVLLGTLAYLSFFFKAKLGYRHALMLVPLASVLAVAAVARHARGRRAAVLGAGLAALALAEQLPYAGNHLAFSNALVWPKRDAWRVMADSNLDWGQNDDKALAWMQASGRPSSRLNPPHLVPGENVVSATAFVFGNHGWARRHLRPSAHFRHTYLVFEMDEARFARMLDEERRLPPETAPECAAAPLRPLADGAPLELEEGARVGLVCARASAEADLGITAASGAALVGRWGRPRREWDTIGPGQTAWFRLSPGTHALAIARGRGLRAAALVRGGPVELAAVAR
jgi:hypothetical protein